MGTIVKKWIMSSGPEPLETQKSVRYNNKSRNSSPMTNRRDERLNTSQDVRTRPSVNRAFITGSTNTRREKTFSIVETTKPKVT